MVYTYIRKRAQKMFEAVTEGTCYYMTQFHYLEWLMQQKKFTKGEGVLVVG
jgi:hypothetical protein